MFQMILSTSIKKKIYYHDIKKKFKKYIFFLNYKNIHSILTEFQLHLYILKGVKLILLVFDIFRCSPIIYYTNK